MSGSRQNSAGRFLLGAGLLLYLGSMGLPVTPEILGPDNLYGYEVAWMCLHSPIRQLLDDPAQLWADDPLGLYFWTFLLSGLQCNLCAVIGWIVLCWNRPTLNWLALGAFVTASLLAAMIPWFPLLHAAAAAELSELYQNWQVGYYVWTVSFVLMSLGVWRRPRIG